MLEIISLLLVIPLSFCIMRDSKNRFIMGNGTVWAVGISLLYIIYVMLLFHLILPFLTKSMRPNIITLLLPFALVIGGLKFLYSSIYKLFSIPSPKFLIERMFNDENPNEAITSLAKTDENIFPCLIKMLGNKKYRYRAKDALIYISNVDFGEDHDKWQKWWDQNQYQVARYNKKIDIKQNLEKLKEKHNIEGIIKYLGSSALDYSARNQAVEILGNLKDPRAIEPLIAALKDANSPVRKSAAISLTKITGKDFGQYPEEWQKWWEQNKDEFLRSR